ncbi:hypothetical protein V6N11_034751 [Hibiscus sabdariffa]|uniref:Uncharacterized protein n=1 Tax=Hibiscus sabdariffa TaxID=183260 RepID=A0ABR2NRX4_9ROSI
MDFHMGRVQIHQHISQFQWAPFSLDPAPKSGLVHGPGLLAAWVSPSSPLPLCSGELLRSPSEPNDSARPPPSHSQVGFIPKGLAFQETRSELSCIFDTAISAAPILLVVIFTT